jgi:hypothetical protein
MTYAPRSARRLATILTSIGLSAIVASGTVLAGTPVTNGYRDHAYGGGAFRPSGDKPQSKLWYTDEGGGAVQWWAGMFRYVASPSTADHRIFKLSADKTDWNATTTVADARDASHGDYLWDEGTNTLYVASVVTPNASDPFVVDATPDGIRVFKYSYDNATDVYTAAAGFPKTIQNTSSTAGPDFRGGAWTVTIAKDSTDRLWMAWPKVADVLYSYSDDDGATWTDPAAVPVQASNPINTGTLSQSDSAAVIAFGNGAPSTVGVMWSDQSSTPDQASNGYYFATIAAGGDPTVAGNWSLQALPAISGTTFDDADNHINLKATSDGTLYMVGKTRTDTVACATNKQRPLIPFYVRPAGGTFGAAHLAGTVGDCNTRPQVVISEQLDVAYLFMTSPNGGGAIYMKSAPLSGADAFDFRGAADQTIQRGIPFIRSATETLIDDPTTTKQPVTAASGIVVNSNNLTSSAGGNAKVFLHNFMNIPATDSTDPTGTVSINGGAAQTSSTTVSVAVPATDTGGSGMSLVEVSNAADMSGSTTYVYTTPIAWALTAGADGPRTVYARWRDAAGNWSAIQSDDITLNTTSEITPPTLPGIPKHRFLGSGRFGFPVRLDWTASTDASPPITYELQRSLNGAAFAPFATTTSAGYSLDLSHSSFSYRFRVRACDSFSNCSAYRTGPTFTTKSYSESNVATKYVGTWSLGSSSVYAGGKARITGTAGRSASLTFVGNQVAWLSRTGPSFGSARVYIDGTLVKTVNLQATTAVDRKLAYVKTWTTSGTHTIRVVVVGTAGHPTVTHDQFYVIR